MIEVGMNYTNFILEQAGLLFLIIEHNVKLDQCSYYDVTLKTICSGRFSYLFPNDESTSVLKTKSGTICQGCQKC